MHEDRWQALTQGTTGIVQEKLLEAEGKSNLPGAWWPFLERSRGTYLRHVKTKLLADY